MSERLDAVWVCGCVCVCQQDNTKTLDLITKLGRCIVYDKFSSSIVFGGDPGSLGDRA